MKSTAVPTKVSKSLERLKAIKKNKKKLKLKRVEDTLAASSVTQREEKQKLIAVVAVVATTVPVLTVSAYGQVDLIPWTFKRPDKVTIKRENWNAHVKRIQANACSEAEKENEELNSQLQQVLNQRDELAVKYHEMSEYVNKFTRSFTATYGA